MSQKLPYQFMQTRIVAALRAALPSSCPVVDHVSREQAMPYCVLWEMALDDESTHNSYDTVMLATIGLYSSAPGFKQANELLSTALGAALGVEGQYDATFAVSGAEFVNSNIARVIGNQNSEIYRYGELTVRYYIRQA